MMKRVALAIFAAAVAFPASAQTIGASGFITYNQNGSSYDYMIHLTNTGTTTIGTLWYSWIPGYDFMSVLPTNIVAPTGWSGQYRQEGGVGDGYSVEFIAATNSRLAAGQSLTGFGFTSTETPAQLSTTSPIFPNLDSGTSYVYDGLPEVGLSQLFIIHPQAAPEPATLLAFAPALLLLRRKRK